MMILKIGKGFVSEHLPYNLIDSRLDASSKLIDTLLDTHKPDVLINCIGKTGSPNIDWCEANKPITALTNTAIPILLAEACAKKSIHLIQIGSGCIYFGQSPNISVATNYGRDYVIDNGWKETDFANPKSFYSKTKYACDLAIGEMPNVTTLRIRMPISSKNSPRNLINKLLKYDQVIDIPNSITMMNDLVKCIEWVIKGSHTGIYHVTNPEPLTAAEVMTEYARHDGDHNFRIIDEEQLDGLTIAKRSNCILNADKLKNKGFIMSASHAALISCMNEFVKNKGK